MKILELAKSIYNKSIANREKVLNVDPNVLVKQIHDEVDSLEDKAIKAVEELLNSIQIPTEDKVVNKADLMKSIGFGDSNETIKQGDASIKRIKESKLLKEINTRKLQLINQYRLDYPNDKIIPFSEFNKVLEKYNLIYAPAKAYIKDVPEKNLLEIKDSKKTLKDHNISNKYLVTDIKLSYLDDTKLFKVRSILKNQQIVIEPSYKYVKKKQYIPSTAFIDDYKETIIEVKEECQPENWTVMRAIGKIIETIPGVSSGNITNYSLSIINRTGLFIAAPKSHFNVDALSTSDGKEYFFKQEIKVTRQEVKDPIAFEMLKGVDNDDEYFVRILSKWGTSDDKSYLDPIVQDQRMN